MRRFLWVLLGVTALIHVPFAFGAAQIARGFGCAHPMLAAFAVAALGVVVFVGRARAGMHDTRRSPLVVGLVDLPYFIHWCACLFTIIPAAVGTLIVIAMDLIRGWDLTIPGGLYAAIYALGLVVCGYGILVRRRWFVVQKLEVRIAGLDPKFDGYRIAHLSDLHIGTSTPGTWGKRWARAANAEAPDLAVLTGDLVTSGTDFYDDVADVVGALHAKDGVFIAMGNHDYFGDGEPLVAQLRARGARVLRNEGHVLRRDGASVYLAGIDDTWTRRDDISKALEGRISGVPAILLAHDPERFREAASHSVDLVLSGHTHGGQIAMPFMARRVSLSHLAHHYHLGLYTKGKSTLFVHPGLGTTGPPMRLGVAPAVVILTLRAAPN